MFCGNCGSQNPDGLDTCSVCGAPLPSPESGETPKKSRLAGLDKNRLVGYAVIAAVVLVVAVVLAVIFSGRSDKAALKKYVSSAYDLNAKGIVKLYPDAVIKRYAQREDISRSEAREEIIDNVQDQIEDYADYYDIDYDEIRGLSVEIRDEEKERKSAVRELNDDFEDEYDIKLKVKEMKTVEVRVKGKYDGDRFSFKISGITLVKIGSSWYVWQPDVGQLYAALYMDVED